MEGTHQEMMGEQPGFKFKFFRLLVFNALKKKMGLDQAKYLTFGAAPMPGKTRNFFFSMNMFVNNIFGMSETTGPMTGLMPRDYNDYNLKSAGKALDGTDISFVKETEEICFRGRNIFMGYLKNEESTRKTIDSQRRVHSGDKGQLDEKSNLLITGRIKELIVTAGGENIAPVIIENIAKEHMPFASNIVLIGDQRKFISCLITLRPDSLASEIPSNNLAPEAIEYFQKNGIVDVTTIDQAIVNEQVINLVNKGKQNKFLYFFSYRGYKSKSCFKSSKNQKMDFYQRRFFYPWRRDDSYFEAQEENNSPEICCRD